MWIKNALSALGLSIFTLHQGNAAIKLPAIISDHMVLQQQTRVTLWGWASPGESLTIKPSWSVGQVKTVADANGNWKVAVPTGKAGGPYTLTFTGSDKIVVNDVLLGEVWLASGQSNMEYPFGPTGRASMPGTSNYKEAMKDANNNRIRQVNVPNLPSAQPLNDFKGEWKAADTATIKDFSAVAWFFAHELNRETGLPIGIINSTWGGTPAESWTRKEALMAQPTLVKLTDKKVKADQYQGSYLNNGMIAPVQNYTLKGVIWYQGENNASRSTEYRTLFPALINDWRKQFNNPDMPFYFVQISPHHKQVPGIRDAQLFTMLNVPHTGMAVTTDNGDSLNIHPTNKELVGKRLSRWALHDLYGKTSLVPSGPIYKSMEISGKTVKLNFDYATGLVFENGPATEFTIAGEDQNFYPAQARISGNQIIVWSDQVSSPKAVRFAWKNFPRPNLYNSDHLPASPFRTDSWEMAPDANE